MGDFERKGESSGLKRPNRRDLLASGAVLGILATRADLGASSGTHDTSGFERNSGVGQLGCPGAVQARACKFGQVRGFLEGW